MIKSFNIINFKGFSNLNISDLSRITLLGGHNNVGKTAFLEAVFLFHDCVNPAMFFQQMNFRGYPVRKIDTESIWTPLFNEYSMDKIIRFDLEREVPEHLSFKFTDKYTSVRRRLEKNGNEIKTNSESISSKALEIIYEKKDNKEKFYCVIDGDQLGLELKKTIKIPAKATFLPARISVSSGDDAAKLGRVDVVNKKDIVVEFLKEIDSRIKDLSTIFINGENVIFADIGMKQKIPVKLMGDGISRLLSIILSIMDSSGGIVLIDEVENGLHYSIMPDIWNTISKVAVEFNCQIIATTHSYECLQSAYTGINNAGNIGDFTYIRLDREDDSIIPKVFKNDLLEMALETNMEVR